jgi:hypothetical protein
MPIWPDPSALASRATAPSSEGENARGLAHLGRWERQPGDQDGTSARAPPQPTHLQASTQFSGCPDIGKDGRQVEGPPL